MLGNKCQRMLGIACLQNDCLRPDLRQYGGETCAEDRMIVDDQHFHATDYCACGKRRTSGQKS
jgi:hypothetical protein